LLNMTAVTDLKVNPPSHYFKHNKNNTKTSQSEQVNPGAYHAKISCNFCLSGHVLLYFVFTRDLQGKNEIVGKTLVELKSTQIK